MDRQIDITSYIEFEPGETAYYLRSQDILKVKICEARINIVVSENAEEISVKYKVDWLSSRLKQSTVNSYYLFKTKDDIYAFQRSKKKEALMENINYHKGEIAQHEVEIKKLQAEIEEIDKEVMVEKLSGLSSETW